MADLLSPLFLLLLLLLPDSCSQRTLDTHQDPAAQPPPAPARIPSPRRSQETRHLNAKPAHQDNAKVGIFIGAAAGTCILMAAVYCIYNKFYNKQAYMHTQLHEDPDHLDPTGSPPAFFQASSEADALRAGYGSLSESPSVISFPPYLSPPPSAVPFPPLFASSSSSPCSSRSLRTISAEDLQRSCF